MKTSRMIQQMKRYLPVNTGLAMLLLVSLSWIACGAAAPKPDVEAHIPALRPEPAQADAQFAQVDMTPPVMPTPQSAREPETDQSDETVNVVVGLKGNLHFKESKKSFDTIEQASEYLAEISPENSIAEKQPRVLLQLPRSVPQHVTLGILQGFQKAGFQRVALQLTDAPKIEDPMETVSANQIAQNDEDDTSFLPPMPEPTQIPLGNNRISVEIEGRGEVAANALVLTTPEETIKMRLTLENPDRAAEAEPVPTSGRFAVEAMKRLLIDMEGGKIAADSAESVRWTAPKAPGLQTMRINLIETLGAGTTSSRLQPTTQHRAEREMMLMVQHPFDREGMGVIDGYPVGLYPNEKGPQASASVQRDPSIFAPPKWFIEVTPKVEDMHLSEHFTVRDFSPDQMHGQRHFIAVQPQLPRFLEALQDAAEERFGDTARIVILRGYMSPNERQLLAQKGINYTLFTRYQYGDATAITLSRDDSKMMADLDADGELTRQDAELLADLVRKVRAEKEIDGWLGSFEKPLEVDWPQTPFVVFDLRSTYND